MQPNLREMNEIKEMIKNEILESSKKDNPVGHIRFETTNTNPSTYLGFGTWVLWGSGRVPVGVNTSDDDFKTVEKTGGSKTANISHTHTIASHNHGGKTGSTTLTVNQIPSHTHSLKTISGTAGGTYWTLATQGYTSVATNADNCTATGGGQGHTHTISDSGQQTTSSAGSTSLSLLQPYITCYMWKRTA